MLRFLCSEDPVARSLRRHFIFKIVPMLNPDGVCHGQHRCSLAGVDLNRKWDAPDPAQHPTIYATKLLLRWLCQQQRRPWVYCDLHGHSRHKNVFLYGCRSGGAAAGVEAHLPRQLAKHMSLFSLPGCRFAVERSKLSTSRVVVWKMGVQRSYTLEMTYCGADQGTHAGQQVDADMLQEAGRGLAEGLHALGGGAILSADAVSEVRHQSLSEAGEGHLEPAAELAERANAAEFSGRHAPHRLADGEAQPETEDDEVLDVLGSWSGGAYVVEDVVDSLNDELEALWRPKPDVGEESAPESAPAQEEQPQYSQLFKVVIRTRPPAGDAGGGE